MRIEISPIDGPADQVPAIRVTDASADQEVSLTVSTRDAKAQSWASRSVFRSDAAGTLDTRRDAPRVADYEGVDPSGPIWSMQFASSDLAPAMFAAPAVQLELTVTSAAEGMESVSAVATQRWSGPDVSRSEVTGEGFVGRIFSPRAPGPYPAVLVVPGSTGPEAMEPTAALLASHGYVSMVIAYMGAAGLPASLCEVPVESLAAGVRELASVCWRRPWAPRER